MYSFSILHTRYFEIRVTVQNHVTLGEAGLAKVPNQMTLPILTQISRNLSPMFHTATLSHNRLYLLKRMQ